MVALAVVVVDAAAVMAWGTEAAWTGSTTAIAARQAAGAAVGLVVGKGTRPALAAQGCGGAFGAERAVGASTAASERQRVGAAM